MAGVSIDAKAIANVYNLPLATINGRTHEGNAVVYAMEFLEGEREETVSWFLSEFLGVVKRSPKVVSSDFRYAILNAVRKVFTQPFIILGDWHLNERQTANINAFLPPTAGVGERDVMSHELFHIRKSPSHPQFLTRRDDFERKWFSNRESPRWFRTSYHVEQELIVHCYNRSRCGLRFPIQSTSYSESSKAEYRRIINTKRVPLSMVPSEMRRALIHRREEQRATNSGINLQTASKIWACGMFMTKECAVQLCHAHTRYALKLFQEESCASALLWALRGHEIGKES